MLHFMNSPAVERTYIVMNTALQGLWNYARLSTHWESIPIHARIMNSVCLCVTPSLHSSLIPIHFSTFSQRDSSQHMRSSTPLPWPWTPILLSPYCCLTHHDSSCVTGIMMIQSWSGHFHSSSYSMRTCGLRSCVLFSYSARFYLLSSLWLTGHQWLLTLHFSGFTKIFWNPQTIVDNPFHFFFFFYPQCAQM